jgi:acetate kinase
MYDMRILVLNCGSSSVKFQLVDMTDESAVAKGLVEKIGTTTATLGYQAKGKNPIREVLEIHDHSAAVRLALETLVGGKHGAIDSKDKISAVGHRVVHGGERFSDSVVIDDEVVEDINICAKFAPLHNPHNLKGIEATSALLPGRDQVAVFDTAFHQKIPTYAYIYALPYALYRKLGIRRYGFHGTSHRFVAQAAAGILEKPLEGLKIITCHLGNGASIAAIRDGYSIDTSMGFTPLEGLVMGSRCGDIDPALVPFIMDRENLSSQDIDNLMNKRSGLLGISETTNDMREIEAEAKDGSQLHKLAMDIFGYRIKKYIGAYAAALGGLDVLVFTGGIGENSRQVRTQATEGLEYMGIKISRENNNKNALDIATGKVRVMVIPTNEELAIAKDTARLLARRKELEIKTKEEEEVERMLGSLTESQKAAIVLTWSQNQGADIDTLARRLREKGIEIGAKALDRLLQNMGLIQPPDEGSDR